MAAGFIKSSLRMAAPAAILLLVPGIAAAEVCDKAGMTIAGIFPTLDHWIEASPEREQFRQILVPSTWITVGILIWLIASNTAKSTLVAAAWFACLAIYHAVLYFSIDLASPYFQAAIKEGCVANSPYRIFTNMAFAAAALMLTWQRIRRPKAGRQSS